MSAIEAAVISSSSGDETRGVAENAKSLIQETSCGDWMTPGSLIAQRIAAIQRVRLVAERLEKTRYAVFVVLDDDPDEVLDAVFEAEQEVMKELPGIPFDLRVRKPHPQWSPDNLLSSCARHYTRP